MTPPISVFASWRVFGSSSAGVSWLGNVSTKPPLWRRWATPSAWPIRICWSTFSTLVTKPEMGRSTFAILFLVFRPSIAGTVTRSWISGSVCTTPIATECLHYRSSRTCSTTCPHTFLLPSWPSKWRSWVVSVEGLPRTASRMTISKCSWTRSRCCRSSPPPTRAHRVHRLKPTATWPHLSARCWRCSGRRCGCVWGRSW
mmetsp:Transcript_18462/g.40379  ORF Transcript_18462/g.40379 Transcript_18462/m.40379 type:complete len:200 (+) Transcript_18462:281-880(+)